MTSPVIITGGGTGGHLFPMLAIGEVFEAQDERVTYVASRRGPDREILSTVNNAIFLPGRGIRRSWRPGALWANFGAVVLLSRSLTQSWTLLRRTKPRCVVSVGGYASLTTSLAAIVTRTPLVLVELDAVASASQRIVRRFAAVRCTAFPDDDPKVVVTGAPIRTEIAGIDRSVDARRMAQRDSVPALRTPCIVVMTGSLGATSVNRAVSALAHQWRDRTDVSLVHVTGRRDFADIVTRAPENCELDYRVVDFADMSTLWRVADVAVCRAGAATVAELDALDIPAVVVPLPGAPGDHQMANAKALAATGRAIVIADADVNQPVFVDAVLRAMSWSSDSRSTPAINNAAASIVRAVDCVGRS